MQDTGKFYKPQVHTNAHVTMIYLGKNVHLCHDLFDCRDEIKIYQQHCGGENVCVYRGKVLEGGEHEKDQLQFNAGKLLFHMDKLLKW